MIIVLLLKQKYKHRPPGWAVTKLRLRASREFTFFFRIPQQRVLPLIRELAIHPSLP